MVQHRLDLSKKTVTYGNNVLEQCYRKKELKAYITKGKAVFRGTEYYE